MLELGRITDDGISMLNDLLEIEELQTKKAKCPSQEHKNEIPTSCEEILTFRPSASKNEESQILETIQTEAETPVVSNLPDKNEKYVTGILSSLFPDQPK